MPEEEGEYGEGAPGSQEIVGVNEHVDGCDIASIGIGVGEVLYEAEGRGFVQLWDDGERGCLEGPNKGFHIALMQGSEIAAMTKLVANNCLKGSSHRLLLKGGIIKGGEYMVERGNAKVEASLNIMVYVWVFM